MRFGSVCSGIEAASVAWEPLGWKAAWFSEIEKFPSSVLAHHYPDTPNLGDMTTLPDRILSGEIEAPEIFCGGTPCQAFSVAGLRQSLNDDRGNLSLTFVGIANAIDHVRSIRGNSSAIIFWENVPGVLNTKDNAFGCFIGALAGEVDPVTCPNGKWSTAGVVVGQKRAVAWRVLDAQYFGVAQRRRRVFVVASARDNFDPTKILFEFDGVRRDTAPSREARQSVAPTVTAGPPFSRTGNDRVETEAIITMAHGQGGAEIAIDRSPTLTCNHEAPIAFHPTQDPISNANVCHSLGANSNATAAVVHPIAWDEELNASIDQAGTLLRGGDGGRRDGVAVPQPIGFDSYNNAVTGDVSKTLDCGQDYHHVPNVAAFKYTMGSKAYGIGYAEEQSPTLDTKADSNAVLQAMQVRRLTPVEYERLQGFPDNYTNIKDKCPDGPRYKALGNSWAVPVVRWIGKRIQEHINAP